MKKLVDTIKKIGSLLAALIPTPIPIGLTEFKKWSDSIVALSGLPDNDSVRFALASTVLYLGPTGAYKPKIYFALVLRAGAAKQVAGAVFQDIKQKQVEAQKTQAEATALKVVANGPTQQGV